MGPQVVRNPRTRVGLLDTTADGETGLKTGTGERGDHWALSRSLCVSTSSPSTPFRDRQTSRVTPDRGAIVDGFEAPLRVHGHLCHHAFS